MLCLELSSQELIVRSGGDTAADAARPGKARGQKSQTHKNFFFGEYICIYEKKLDLAKKVLARPGELTEPPRGPVDGTRATMSFSKKFQKKFPHFHLNFFSHGSDADLFLRQNIHLN